MTHSDDVQPDDTARFAADLRRAKVAAGDPTVIALGHATGVSKSVVADAFKGYRLPTARTVRALVIAFGEDADAWVARRDALAGVAVAPPALASTPSPATRPAPATPSAPTTGLPAAAPDGVASSGKDASAPRSRAALATGSSVRLVRLRTAVALAVVGLLVGVGVTAAVVRTPVATAASPRVTVTVTATARPTEGAISAISGTDPAKTACVDDAKPVESEIRTLNTKLEIIYSAACDAVWSRITRTDNDGYGQSVTTDVYEKNRPQAADRQTTTEKDVDSAYTTLLVRPTPDTRVCATGSITVAGKPVSLGAPLCL